MSFQILFGGIVGQRIALQHVFFPFVVIFRIQEWRQGIELGNNIAMQSDDDNDYGGDDDEEGQNTIAGLKLIGEECLGETRKREREQELELDLKPDC